MADRAAVLAGGTRGLSPGQCQVRWLRTRRYPSGSAIVMPPLLPVGVAGLHARPLSVDQLPLKVVVDRAAQVKHEQVFLRRRGRRGAVGIVHELEVPSRLWPAEHDQPVTFLIGRDAEQLA